MFPLTISLQRDQYLPLYHTGIITNGRIGIKGQKTSTNGLLKKKSQLYLNVTFQRRESSIANEILPGKQEVLSRNQKHMKLQAVSCACVYS